MTTADADIRLIVFDLDGTLIDSRRDLADATNALISELGGRALPIETVAGLVGEGAAVLVRRALDATGLNADPQRALTRFLELYDERLLVYTRPYDGIPETLHTLSRSWPLAVLTNKPARATSAILDGLGLAPFFRAVVGGDTPLGRKPDATGLSSIVDDLDATPATTMLVGDSRIDLQTARNAGCRVCLARYGFGFSFTNEDFRGDEWFVESPHGILRLFERLLRRIPWT
jgi:phosphoglycolate phosphatase